MSENKAPDDQKEAPAKGSIGLVGIASLGLAAGLGAFLTNYLAPTTEAEVATCALASTTLPVEPLFETPEAFVPLPEILITIGRTPATRYLKMNVTIATNGSGVSSIKSAEPVLIDAFNNYLRSIELADFEDPGFYAHMREQLAHRAEIILGAETAGGVLITEFLLR